MEVMGVAGVAAIAIICYLAGGIVKKSPLDNKWIPTICMALGGCLGVVGMYVMPDFPASDILSGIAVGIVSGGAATCVDQAFKQLRGGEAE